MFPTSIAVDDLRKIGLEIGHKTLPTGEERYAEHPYISGKFQGFDTDIVPCYKLDDIKEAGTIVTYTESCSKTASLIALKSVDAIIGWRVFASWNPDTTEAVYLEPGQIPRIAHIPGAISAFTENRKSAQQFLDFLVSTEGQGIFRKWGYISTEEEARQFAPDAETGGEYQLPANYEPLVK